MCLTMRYISQNKDKPQNTHLPYNGSNHKQRISNHRLTTLDWKTPTPPTAETSGGVLKYILQAESLP